MSGEKRLGAKRMEKLSRKKDEKSKIGEWIDLPPAQSMILDHVKTHPGATEEEICQRFQKYTLQTIQNSLGRLRFMGLIP